MLRYVFPQGIYDSNNKTLTVWIDLELHKPLIDKIERVNQYLANVIKEQAKLSSCVSFQYTPRYPYRKAYRYEKLRYWSEYSIWIVNR